MNDTTLPLPSKGGAAPKNPRRRPEGHVQPGFGLHGWMTLLRRAKDLAQRKGAPLRRDIPLAEVRAHDKPYDGWVVLRGKVYNISPYLAYHPGGSAILEKCLGRDATALFDKYHAWVNLDGLVGPLLLGYVKAEEKGAGDDGGGGGYLTGNGAGGAANDGGGGGGEIVIPSGGASAASANSARATDDVGFAMPKPRPPKGAPIPSLLPNSNADDDDDAEDDALKF